MMPLTGLIGSVRGCWIVDGFEDGSLFDVWVEFLCSPR